MIDNKSKDEELAKRSQDMNLDRENLFLEIKNL